MSKEPNGTAQGEFMHESLEKDIKLDIPASRLHGENTMLRQEIEQLQAENKQLKKVVHEQGKCLASVKYNMSKP